VAVLEKLINDILDLKNDLESIIEQLEVVNKIKNKNMIP
jgi:t-SNARE complex subunit (syntaxin)